MSSIVIAAATNTSVPSSGVFVDPNLLSFKTSPAYPVSIISPDTNQLGNGFWPVFTDVVSWIGIIVAFILIIIFSAYSSTVVVQKSNLFWLILILLSIILVFWATVLFTFKQTTFTCTFKAIILMIGVGLLVSCLTVKSVRIFRVFLGSSVAEDILSTGEIFITGGLVLVPNIALLFVYLFGAGGLPTNILVQSSADPTYFFIACIPNGDATFQYILVALFLGYNLVVVAMCAIMLFMSRGIVTVVGERFYLFLVLVDFIILGALMIPLYYTVGETTGSLLQQFLIRAQTTIFALHLTLILLAYPRIVAIIREQKEQKERQERRVENNNFPLTSAGDTEDDAYSDTTYAESDSNTGLFTDDNDGESGITSPRSAIPSTVTSP